MAIPTPQYVYRARVARLIDGDSCVLTLDLGCHVAVTRAVRLRGVDTPELVGASRAAGLAARDYAADWLTVADDGAAWPLVAATMLDRGDKFGRLLATVYRITDGACLNADLLAAGHAVGYEGGARG